MAAAPATRGARETGAVSRGIAVGGVKSAVRVIALPRRIHAVGGAGVNGLITVEAAGGHQVGLNRTVYRRPFRGVAGERIHHRSIRQRHFGARGIDGHGGAGVRIHIGLQVLAVRQRDQSRWAHKSQVLLLKMQVPVGFAKAVLSAI